MSETVVGSLIGGAFALLVALVGVIGPRVVLRAQRKAEDNERRLQSLEEGNQHLIANLRLDYDRAIARAVAAEGREAEWRSRAIKAERRVDQYLQDREKP